MQTFDMDDKPEEKKPLKEKPVGKPEKEEPEETKACPECLADIPKAAKKCMHCGSKQRQEVGLLGILLAMALLAMFIVPLLTSNDKPRQPPTPEQQAVHDAVKQASKSKGDAGKLCRQAVQASAKFPRSVDFSVLNTPPTQPMHGGGWIVRPAFESKNGFGNIIPQIARCEVKDGKLTYFNVSNR